MTSLRSESSSTDFKVRTRLSSSWVAFRCILRGLPLFFAANPGTPLRVLCIIAFDLVFSLRNARGLSKRCISNLALFLDFGACLNAAMDGKRFCPAEFRKLQGSLENARLGHTANDYLRSIQQLELKRPVAFRDHLQSEDTLRYRENIVGLNLTFLALLSLECGSLEQCLKATHADHDLSLLFRIVMQCQIIDDVFDYSKDVRQRLPGFLTASARLGESFDMTWNAARRYASGHSCSRIGSLFPLQTALFIVSVTAKTLIILGRWRQRSQIAKMNSYELPVPGT